MDLFNKINTPISWALLYILMIPLFAFIYFQNSEMFRVSNPQNDTGYRESYQTAELLLLTHFAKQFSLFCDQCEDRTLAAWMTDVSESSVVLELTYFDIQDREAVTTDQVDIRIIVMPQRGNMADDFFSARLPIDFDIDSIGHVEFENFLTQELSIRGAVFDKQTQVALLELIDRSDGVYDSVAFDFSRYIYLSVVTITTLGYGDIVPISNISRYLVSVQSIIGVVLMGLFINSAAMGIAGRANI